MLPEGRAHSFDLLPDPESRKRFRHGSQKKVKKRICRVFWRKRKNLTVIKRHECAETESCAFARATIKTAKQLSVIYSHLHILVNFCTSLAQRGKTLETSCWTLQRHPLKLTQSNKHMLVFPAAKPLNYMCASCVCVCVCLI